MIIRVRELKGVARDTGDVLAAAIKEAWRRSLPDFYTPEQIQESLQRHGEPERKPDGTYRVHVSKGRRKGKPVFIYSLEADGGVTVAYWLDIAGLSDEDLPFGDYINVTFSGVDRQRFYRMLDSEGITLL